MISNLKIGDPVCSLEIHHYGRVVEVTEVDGKQYATVHWFHNQMTGTYSTSRLERA